MMAYRTKRLLLSHSPSTGLCARGEAFPSKGAELSNAWRTRQFEYTWLRTISRSYADFWKVTEDEWPEEDENQGGTE